MVLQNAMLQKYVVVVCTPEAAGEEKVGSVLVFLNTIRQRGCSTRTHGVLHPG